MDVPDRPVDGAVSTVDGGTVTPRVLIVEDDRALREAMDMALGEEGYSVQSVAVGVGVQDVLEGFRPDVAILDVRLPEGPDGFEVARTIRRVSDVPVVFVTAADDLEDRLEGFDAGGDDYIVKPFAMPELLARIHALLRRTGREMSRTIQVGELLIDREAREVRYRGEPVELTPRELDLLAALAREPGRVLSKRRLLALVWDFAAYDENLVEVYVHTVRNKLEEHGPRIVHTVRGAGYVLRV